MKVKELLTEMPRIIIGLNKLDDLSIDSVNKAKYKLLSTLQDKKEIKRSDDLIVYQTGNMFYSLDKETKKVIYYMQYDTSYTKTLGSFLWQSLVWRDENSVLVKTIPHKIFFEYLLPKYGIIATDGDQTKDGKRFWEYQVAYSLENNINVYYFNLKSKELELIKSLTEFNRAIKKYDIWGESKDHQNKLIVITNHVLPRETIFNNT